MILERLGLKATTDTGRDTKIEQVGQTSRQIQSSLWKTNDYSDWGNASIGEQAVLDHGQETKCAHIADIAASHEQNRRDQYRI